MEKLQLPLSKINELYEKIAEEKELFLPVKKANETNFAKWNKDACVDIEALKTVKSAKELFFPQSEDLMGFKIKNKEISIIELKEKIKPFVIFGVRACDYSAITNVLDRVFLVEPKDTYYEARRNMGIIITLACNEPEESCFCNTFGINPEEPMGDITCWKNNEKLFWQANSEKGEELTEKLKDLFEEAKETEISLIKEQIKEIKQQLPLFNLSTKAWDNADLLERFNDEKWEKLSKGCLGCGTCTFVCPTCQCYDISDFKSGDGVARFRCWDSCMFSDFTKMAHGNPRKSQVERFRQRFMHKLVYFPENNEGVYSCVGCGRCVDKCPQSLNIVKVIKAFGGEGNE